MHRQSSISPADKLRNSRGSTLRLIVFRCLKPNAAAPFLVSRLLFLLPHPVILCSFSLNRPDVRQHFSLSHYELNRFGSIIGWILVATKKPSNQISKRRVLHRPVVLARSFSVISTDIFLRTESPSSRTALSFSASAA